MSRQPIQRRFIRLATLVAAPLAIVLFVVVSGASSARIPWATITVTTTADGSGGPDCTLRDAITSANTDTATGGCDAGNGADTIVFSVSGEIGLGSTLPAVTSVLTIDGSGQNITVSGQDAVRVLQVESGASLTLHGVAIVHGHGNGGGGIFNSGTLHVTQSSFTNNGATTYHEGGCALQRWERDHRGQQLLE